MACEKLELRGQAECADHGGVHVDTLQCFEVARVRRIRAWERCKREALSAST